MRILLFSLGKVSHRHSYAPGQATMRFLVNCYAHGRNNEESACV